MKKILAATAVALSLMSSAAMAGERPTDAALGAVSGAVVFGPIGAVAGAVVGYAAGPSISHSWRRTHGVRHARRQPSPQARADASDGPPAARNDGAPHAVPAAAESPKVTSVALPPVQGFE
jgi:hypothetical protein